MDLKIKKIAILSGACVFLLAGCSVIKDYGSSQNESENTSVYSSSQNENGSSTSTNDGTKNYIENHEANKNVTLADLDYNTPSTGTQPVLVIPITFTDQTFTDQEIIDIKTLTGGSSSDTNYWESLASYYEKSSYGKLKLKFTYSDPISMGVTAKSFYQSYGSTSTDSNYGKGASIAMKKAIAQYKKTNGNNSTKKFDTDGDGYIDSVIMIYAQDSTPSYDKTDFYWAYRFFDLYSDNYEYKGYAPNGNVSSPIGNSYFWASVDTIYEGTGGRENHTGVDAHTLIHEFGHMLGADDYYNPDSNPKSEPTGGKIMMAYNILDHDAFNKLQFNWITPTYVYGDATITISSFEETGNCLLLADDNGWNETAFDEYVLVELYTPTGLNELDSKTAYSKIGRGQSKPGVRMWHVDNRLAKINSQGNAVGYYSDEEVKQGNFGDKYYPYVASSNGKEYDLINDSFDSLSLISSLGTSFTTDNLSTDKDLFHAGDSFSLSKAKYTKYFANSNHLNNGNSFPYEITVKTLSDDSATIQITRTDK